MNRQATRLLLLMTTTTLLACAFGGCRPEVIPTFTAPAAALDGVANTYVALVLALGRHDEGYVDAYYGPPEWLQEAASTQQRLLFIETYRSYVINYNLGLDLVRGYVEKKAGGDDAKRWEVFGELLSTPRLPSSLQVD